MFRSEAAERAVVGAILQDPGAIADIVDIVNPPDFVTEPSAVVYEAMAALWERRVPADVITVMNELGSEDAATVVSGLLLDAPLGVNVVYYARIVASQAERRRFWEASQKAVGDLYEDASLSVDDALISVAEHTRGGHVISQMRSAHDAVATMLDRVELEQAGLVERLEVSTGFTELDDLLGGGFSPGELVTLAARSSMGKTSLAADFLMTASEDGKAVLFSAEMSTDSVMRRLASRASGVPMDAIRKGTMTREQMEAFRTASLELQQRDFYIDDTPGITTDQMMLRVQRLQSEGRVSEVAFDYLEMVGDQLPDGRDDTHARLSRAVERLKSLAMVCEVPVVLLSQVGRGIDSRPNKVPMLSDLRWTATLEQTSDKVLMIYIHDYYVNRGIETYEADREGVVEIHIQKNRNGPIGMAKLGYEPETFRFIDPMTGVIR